MPTLKDLYDETVREYERTIAHYESRLDLLRDLIDRGMGHHEVPDHANPDASIPAETAPADAP